MKIVVIADLKQQKDWISRGFSGPDEPEWVQTPDSVTAADHIIDLLFDGTPDRIQLLHHITTGLVLVNAVSITAEQLPDRFIRINGWPTWLQLEKTEATAASPEYREKAAGVLSLFGRKPVWVPDQPGFIAPRVVSMIINEAYLALEEEVSTKEEIDTAMKLGTNYPMGPFEWAQQAGLKNIYHLLEILAVKHPRYQPARLLQQEALAT